MPGLSPSAEVSSNEQHRLRIPDSLLQEIPVDFPGASL